MQFVNVPSTDVGDPGDGKSIKVKQEEFQECETGGFYGLAKDLLKITKFELEEMLN